MTSSLSTIAFGLVKWNAVAQGTVGVFEHGAAALSAFDVVTVQVTVEAVGLGLIMRRRRGLVMMMMT